MAKPHAMTHGVGMQSCVKLVLTQPVLAPAPLRYWTLATERPATWVPVRDALPSDSRYRQVGHAKVFAKHPCCAGAIAA